MSRNPEVKPVIDALVGTWTGRGRGVYPTIEPFEYRESTRITERNDHPALHYEQRAWRLTPDGEVVSHWETGLLRISGDGTVALHNAQGGRAESMTGSWDVDDEGWSMRVAGIGYAGDSRVTDSTRVIHLDSSTLTYEMHMETTSTRELVLHLEARLHKDI